MMEGDVPIHSVRLPGHRRRPGGHPRRRRADAHDPPRHHRPHELHARRAAGDPPRRGPARVPGRRARAPAVRRVTIGVTDHAVERYLQRVRGVLDAAAGDRRPCPRGVGGRQRRRRRARHGPRPRPRPPRPRLRLHPRPPARRARRRDAVGGGRGPRRAARVHRRAAARRRGELRLGRAASELGRGGPSCEVVQPQPDSTSHSTHGTRPIPPPSMPQFEP